MLTDEERAIEELRYKERVEADKGGPTLKRPNVFQFAPYVPKASQAKRRKQGRR